LTGISPNEPENPVYPQHHGPRLAQARRQLQALGYDIREGLRDGLEHFEIEASLPPLGSLRKTAWTALQELRDTDTPLDPTRWRTRNKTWRPAIRRAIRVRSEELGLVPPRPVFFSDAELEAPDDAEIEQTLQEIADTSKSTLPAMQLVAHLFNENPVDDPETQQLVRLGVDTSASDEPSGEPSVPLAFGLEDVEERLKQLFTSCLAIPELRRPPTTEEHDAFLPELANFLDRGTQDVNELWARFSAKSQLVWPGHNRACRWLQGSKSWLHEACQDIESGLLELVDTSNRNLRQLGAYGQAVYTNVFRVVYHSLCEVFERVHDAHLFLIQTLVSGSSESEAPVQLLRNSRRLVAVVDGAASSDDIHAFVRRNRGRNRMFELACELVGCLLGALVRGGFGTMTAGVALVGLTRVAPRVLSLGREFAALAAGQAS